MCLILFAYEVHPDYRLLLGANRDEFYRRPTAPAAFWAEAPDLLAGRDLERGGTWFGVTRQGRFAMVTNVRSAEEIGREGRSRGLLVSEFLLGRTPPRDYLRALHRQRGAYRGFNLLVGDAQGVYYYSNRHEKVGALQPGVYGLSNHLLDSDWPKVRGGKRDLGRLLAGEPKEEGMFALLADRTPAPDDQLPATGFGVEWERLLSPRFIRSAEYGTRCSTLLFWRRDDQIRVAERRFAGNSGEIAGENRWYFSVQPEK